VLLRDLPSLYGISSIQELNRLFTVLAFNTGQEISLEALGKDSGVAKNTLIRYLDYLEAAFLIQRITRVDENAQRMKRNRTFKVFLTNPSMRAALFGPLTEDDPAFGHVVETVVFCSTRYLYEPDPAYARWDKGEIDFVRLDQVTQQPSSAVEVKWSDREKSLQDAAQTLEDYALRNKIERTILTTKTTDTELRAANPAVRCYPTALYCYHAAQSVQMLNAVLMGTANPIKEQVHG
jgi:uncharacterized protein